MIPGRLDPLALARISLVAASSDIYNSDSNISASSTPTITANSSSSPSAPTLTASDVEFFSCSHFPSSVFPGIGETQKERSLEHSPAYASNFNDISSGGSVMPPPPEPTNLSIQSSFEADYSMRSMDYLYQANFYDYIKDESNVGTVSRHLNRVIKDYKLRPVACGLRWLIGDWSTDTTVRLLRSIMKEWLPDVAGLLVDLIHDGVLHNGSGSSTFYADGVGKMVAGLLKGESPAVSAVFMHSLTESWTLKAVSNLIADVDALLGWNETYFHQFTNSYIACVIHTTSIRDLGWGGTKRLSNQFLFTNRHPDATISSTTTDGDRETKEEFSGRESQKKDEKEEEKSLHAGKSKEQIGEGGSTGSQGQERTGELDESRTSQSGLRTLERLTSIYQTNLAVCNYRLALANFKLALLENNIQCDLNRTYALSLAASRHSSFSGSTPNLHFGVKKDEDVSEGRDKNKTPKEHIRSHFDSLISLRWAMTPDECSPAVSDRLDQTGSATSIRSLCGLDVASRDHRVVIPLNTLSGVEQRTAFFGDPPTGRGRRRRVSCPGRVCHSSWHVDPVEDEIDVIDRAGPSSSGAASERGSRRSSQASANSASEREARSMRSSLSRTSDFHSARRSSGRSLVSQFRRASLRRSIRPPPANFLRSSTAAMGFAPVTAQDLTIQTLNSLSRPAPNLDSDGDYASLASNRVPASTVPGSASSSTPTNVASSSGSGPATAHRNNSHRQSRNSHNHASRACATSRTSFSSSSSSFASNSFDPPQAYSHWNSPVHPTYQYTAYPYATYEEYDPNFRSLFSVPPDRIRSYHPVHVPGPVPFSSNPNGSTANGDDQEKSLSEINEFLNTNSRPASTDRLEYRRGVGIPGDVRRTSAIGVGSAGASLGAPGGTRTDRSTCSVRS